MSHNNNPENEIPYTDEEYEEMAEILLSKQPHRPTIGIICGSGLTNIVSKLEEKYEVPYEKIPNFPVCTGSNHTGQFVFGTLNGKKVIVMQGRFYLYEGYPAWKVVAPVRVMKILGVETLIVTNSSGGLNPFYQVGDIMIFVDHIGIPTLTGLNPLMGKNSEKFGPRFVDMARVYDEKLRLAALQVSEEIQCSASMREGVYTMVTGPSYPTPAEARYLRSQGSDAIGMTTIPEVLTARHCGMRVLALTLIADLVTTDYRARARTSDDDIVDTKQRRDGSIQELVTGVIDRIGTD